MSGSIAEALFPQHHNVPPPSRQIVTRAGGLFVNACDETGAESLLIAPLPEDGVRPRSNKIHRHTNSTQYKSRRFPFPAWRTPPLSAAGLRRKEALLITPVGPNKTWAGSENYRYTTRPRRPVVMTPITLRIEVLIQRLAAAGHEMSSNVILAGVLDGPGRETVRRSIERLLLAGRITIESTPGLRRATICATGLSTGWGKFVTTGHAPYSLHPRGSMPPKAVARPDYKPVENAAFRYRVEPQRMVETTPSPMCEYVIETPGKPDCACKEKSVSGYSWCLGHGKLIFSPSWTGERKPPRSN